MKMKRILCALTAAVMLGTGTIVTAGAAQNDTVILNLDELSAFKGRTREQVGEKYSEVQTIAPTYSNRDRSTWYSVPSSTENPYEPGVLTEDTHKAMLGMTNYFRWLAGCPAYSESIESSADLQAGALVRNFEFDHYISAESKPEDMSDALWEQGANASHNIIAMGYTPRGSVTGWMNEGYNSWSGSWDTTGHRHALISPYYEGVAFGYSGSVGIGKILYAQNDLSYNPDDVTFAFPSPGYFPNDLIRSYSSVWEVCFAEKTLHAEENADVTVTITNLNTGKVMERSTADDTVRTGDTIVLFAQPDDADGSTYTDSYRVNIKGLKNTDGKDAEVVYNVNFFDVKDYAPTQVSSVANEWNYIVYESMKDADSLQKIGAILPKKVPVQTQSGKTCEVDILGNWKLDEEKQCWYAAADPQSLPENATDPKGLLSRVEVKYTISDDYYDSFNYFTVSPGEAKSGDEVTFKVTRVATSAKVSEVYRVTPNGDGTYSGEQRFNSKTSPEFSTEDNDHVYTKAVTPADSGEYLSVYYYDNGYFNSRYVSVRTQTLTVEGAVLKGDVNGDGKVDVTDATLVQMFAAELIDLSADRQKAADVTGDGKIDVTDATLIQMYAAELIDKF